MSEPMFLEVPLSMGWDRKWGGVAVIDVTETTAAYLRGLKDRIRPFMEKTVEPDLVTVTCQWHTWMREPFKVSSVMRETSGGSTSLSAVSVVSGYGVCWADLGDASGSHTSWWTKDFSSHQLEEIAAALDAAFEARRAESKGAGVSSGV